MNTNFKIIPAIDLLNGKCVRLKQGNYKSKTVYSKDPVSVAKTFEDAGLRYLHVVDLDGARSKRILNHKIIEKIATTTNLTIDFGGGIKSQKDLDIAFNSGAHQVTCGSISVTNPDLVKEWISIYGNDKVILGADCRNRKIAIHGWQQHCDIDVIEFIKNFQSAGIQNTICTDIDKDGILQGPSLLLYKEIISQTKTNLIASGGVSSINDIKSLKEIGCEGVIIGKAIYEKRISIKQLSELC